MSELVSYFLHFEILCLEGECWASKSNYPTNKCEDLFWTFNPELLNIELLCHKKHSHGEFFVFVFVELCSNRTFLATTIKDTPSNPHIHHRTTIFKAITFIVTSRLALAMINIPRCPFLRIRRLGLCTAVNSLKVFSYFSFLLKREGCEFHF